MTLTSMIFAASLAASSASGPAPGAPPAPSPAADPANAVIAAAGEHHGQVAVYAENLRTGRTITLDADAPVPTASVIKLAALYEAMAQLRDGRVRFDERLKLTRDNQVEGSGLLAFLDTPAELTFKDALTMMIVASDNTATNMVLDRLGGPGVVTARMRSLGLTQTTFYKKVFKPIEGPVPPEQPRFGLGRTTAREMAQLMTRIVRCRLDTARGPAAAEPAASDRAICAVTLKMLRDQQDRQGIPRYLEGVDSSVDGSAIAHKTGAVDAARNDVAALATPEGTIVLSIFTHDNRDQSWSVDDEGDRTIARIARIIVNAWSPKGLDASKGW